MSHSLNDDEVRAIARALWEQRPATPDLIDTTAIDRLPYYAPAPHGPVCPHGVTAGAIIRASTGTALCPFCRLGLRGPA